MIKLHDLQPSEGSNKRGKRKARGIGGKGGKTAGRGTKGQRARNTVAVGFEGGQMPLLRRVPKLRGFTNPFRVANQVVNLRDLEALEATTVNPEVLAQAGLVGNVKKPVKILGIGEITKKFQVTGCGASKTAREKIEKAGGSFGDQ